MTSLVAFDDVGMSKTLDVYETMLIAIGLVVQAVSVFNGLVQVKHQVEALAERLGRTGEVDCASGVADAHALAHTYRRARTRTSW